MNFQKYPTTTTTKTPTQTYKVKGNKKVVIVTLFAKMKYTHKGKTWNGISEMIIQTLKLMV